MTVGGAVPVVGVMGYAGVGVGVGVVELGWLNWAAAAGVRALLKESLNISLNSALMLLTISLRRYSISWGANKHPDKLPEKFSFSLQLRF